MRNEIRDRERSHGGRKETIMSPRLGRIGIWRPAPFLTGAVGAETAAELEELGYGTLWVGGSPSADLDVVEHLLAATTRLVVATGIVNIWDSPADTVAESFHRIEARYPNRFLLGIGAGHREAVGAGYVRPYTRLVEYLDELDSAARPVPLDRRVLAALGPRALRLAGERTAGAHPYLTTPEHTRRAREVLGAGVLLAPEHKVVLESDPATARAVGRPPVANPYLRLVNYTNNLLRLGYTEQDIADDGSDALIDDLVAWGTDESVAAKVTAHLDAGADHVSVQVLTADGADPRPAYRRLATVLPL
ncbi:TIGR03620 family F420-dependent LLM class oxidoreductase [Actinoalloteichus sp. AHMU CJ021]|nr:TIGR03620 family F420-dependent LLM class oxidoreductase [Actinoalloteichus sp. AHMU CJ021]